MSIAKAFYQCHILRFLSSHLVQLPYHRSLSYQSAYNRRHARPCLSSMYGCIRRGTVSVSIENYWQTERLFSGLTFRNGIRRSTGRR